MKIYSYSNIGKVRKNNEDYVYSDENTGIHIVADGMGGHNAGEVASKETVEAFVEYLIKFDRINKDNLLEALSYANKAVYNLSINNSKFAGMGTTFTGAYIENFIATIIHVGDSRAYKFSEGILVQITDDHTLLNELYKKGNISDNEYENSKNKHVLVKAIGTQSIVLPDVFIENFKANDYLILSSDGLTDQVALDEINLHIIKYKEPKEIVEKLINSANEKGGNDNISLVCIKFENKKEL